VNDRSPDPGLPSQEAEGTEAVAGAESAIDRLRENIDSVDTVLVKLLNQRAKWALEIGDVKKTVGIPVYQPDREAKVLGRVLERNRGPLPADAIRRLFERIIDESRRLERIGSEGAAGEGSRAHGSWEGSS
jgi:chorismate mutase